MGLKEGLLNGDILLNLDTEEDNEIGVGCAGGIDITAERNYKQETTPETKIGYMIVVNGLQGGTFRNGYTKRIWKCKQDYEPNTF